MEDADECEIEKMSVEGVFFDEKTPILYDSKFVNRERAQLLQLFASRFVLMHELGHIFNGHCEYMASVEKKFKGIPMYYSDEDCLKNVAPLDVRTLEMDADAFAVTQSIQHLFCLHANFDTQVNCYGLKPDDLFYYWSFAIRSHFLLCEDYLNDSNAYNDKMKHMPSSARWGSVLGIVLKMFDMVELDKNEQFQHYEKEINGNWNNVIEKIRKFACCPLYEEHEVNNF